MHVLISQTFGKYLNKMFAKRLRFVYDEELSKCLSNNFKHLIQWNVYHTCVWLCCMLYIQCLANVAVLYIMCQMLGKCCCVIYYVSNAWQMLLCYILCIQCLANDVVLYIMCQMLGKCWCVVCYVLPENQVWNIGWFPIYFYMKVEIAFPPCK